MQKIMLFEEFLSFEEMELNEGALNRFFNKMRFKANKKTSKYIFAPIMAIGDKNLVRKDVKKLLEYFEIYFEQNPEVNPHKFLKKGSRGSMVKPEPLMDTKANIEAFRNFYNWLEDKDKTFAESYLNGALKKTYDGLDDRKTAGLIKKVIAKLTEVGI